MTQEQIDQCGAMTKRLITSLRKIPTPTKLWLVYPTEPLKEYGSELYYTMKAAMDEAAIMSAATGVKWKIKRVKATKI